MTEAALYDVLKRFKAIGCNLAEYPKIPEIIFSTRNTYAERFNLLKKAKNTSYVIDSIPQKGNVILISATSVELYLDEKSTIKPATQKWIV